MTGSDTKPEWTFRPILQKGEKVSNPQPSREFERAGHVHSICGDPLQNSLDARLDPNAPVVFEMGIWDGERRLSQEDASTYFGRELRRHIKAVSDEDQASKIDTFEEPLAFITLEDFNALGLIGKVDAFQLPWSDISETALKEINDNRFLWFNRAQNATSDAQDRRGSWGEGKFTLEWASRLGAQIAWSIRADETEPRQVLMGQTTLRRHSIYAPTEGYGMVDDLGTIERANFAPYGYFSTTRFSDPPEDYAPLPVEDEGYISQFREQFRMVRDDEPGTSILIPHPHEEVRKPSALARGIIARWLLAIHAGEVVVNIRKNGELVHSLSKETIRSEVKALNWDVEEEKVGTGNERNPACRTVEQWIGILDLLDWAEDPPEDATFHIDDAGGSHQPTWAIPFWDTPENEGTQERLREAFESGDPVKITAHPFVNSKKDGTQFGKFDVIMRKAAKEHSTQVYARERMAVPLMEDVEGAIAVVHCHESALLKLLRHSEGPAHLKWAQGARRVIPSGGYWKLGRGTVLYVNDSVKHLLTLMKPPIEEQEHAVSLFSISIFDGGTPPPDGPDGPVEPPTPIIPPPREPDVCRIPSKGYQGSVRVRHNPDFAIRGKTITVNLAYETSKGKPWTKYSELDFSASDLAVSSKGATMVDVVPKPTPQHGLVYTFDITSDKWKIDFSGFDGKRDISCDVKRVA